MAYLLICGLLHGGRVEVASLLIIMTVVLCQSREFTDTCDGPNVLDLTGSVTPREEMKQIPSTAELLETVFQKTAPNWWALGKEMGRDATAIFSHTPSCAPNTSDFGLMLAWSEIVRQRAERDDVTLVICNDPWLFRHLALIEGVEAGKIPRLWVTVSRQFLRGWLARLKFSAAALLKLILLRHQRRLAVSGAPTLLAYANPNSSSDGVDGYFGDLMSHIDNLTRVIHVDGPVSRIRRLTKCERTTSLNAWGALSSVLKLPWARWRPARRHFNGPYGWLVRRAVSKEGATAQAAAIAWQVDCQSRWLNQARPAVVAWPWENHGWERGFVRQARDLGIKSIGYQHSVIGAEMFNYSPASNPNGLEDLPDDILCNGQATLNQLFTWGVPADRLEIGGAFRIPKVRHCRPDPGGQVYLALPFDGETARQMVDAALSLIPKNYQFFVKDHPMTPFEFTERDGLQRTHLQFFEIDGLAAVVYAATTVGLVSALAGLPTIRFQPRGIIALNILPSEVSLPAATEDNLESALQCAIPSEITRDGIFSPVNMEVWRECLTV